MEVVLFLPESASPPYQTVIYFPGSGSIFNGTSRNLHDYYEFPVFLSFLVKTGRAVVYPIYNGTFERADETLTQLHLSLPTNAYTEYVIRLVQDFKRSVDYLETREDLDPERLAFYGMSWGGILGPIMAAADERVSNMILVAGGMTSDGRPESHPVHYAPRVDVPVLMLSGKYDSLLGYETSVVPLYELLGTADEDKVLKVYETDHIPPKKEFVTEILNWLDEYFGPVRQTD
jgi:cephalosporin-C deacetylase-like acetyl esterase